MDRLLEVEKHAVDQTNEQIQLLEKYLSDYKVLQEKLNTLPNEYQYDIMVPFGSVGFMPGRLVHTNEVKLLLGEDWFVETTTSHAVEIIQRRNAKLSDQIEDLNKQKKLIESRIEFTDQLTQSFREEKDVVEIREEFDEEAEELWKKKHKENVKQYYENIKKLEKKAQCISSDFWDQYEDNDDDIVVIDDVKLKRKVSFGDNLKFNDDDDNHLKAKTIFFVHSNFEPNVINEIGKINSPSDIQFNVPLVPKSILKKQSTSDQVENEPDLNNIVDPKDIQHPVEVDKESFDSKEKLNENRMPPCSNVVVERNLQSQEDIMIPNSNETKKISKFKATRLKKI